MYVIGDPGRAAREVPDGPPPHPAGESDVELSAASLPGMVVRAASTRGLVHRARGTPRQDAFALATAPDSPARLVAAVCDGVGQFERSGEAARLASRELAAMVADGATWERAFGHVNDLLHKEPEPMATTVVAVVVRREAGQWIGAAAWVGDSALWHLDPGGTWREVTGDADRDLADGAADTADTADVDEDEFYDSRVRPLPSADGAFGLKEFRLDGGMLAIMTDGVSNPLRWSDQVKQELARWWRDPPDPFDFAAQVGFARRSHMDDRTVVGIWPGGDGNDADEDPQDQEG